MKEEEMIREKDDKLRIVTLNLRCIEVLCGYTTKDLHSAYCNNFFSVLSFLKCSAEFNTLNYLCLKIFYFFFVSRIWFFSSSHIFSSVSLLPLLIQTLMFQRISPQPTTQLLPNACSGCPRI